MSQIDSLQRFERTALFAALLLLSVGLAPRRGVADDPVPDAEAASPADASAPDAAAPATAAPATAAPATAAPATEVVELRWKLIPGETVRYRIQTNQVTHQTIGRHSFDNKQHLDVEYALTAQERFDDGSVRVRCRYDRVVIELDQMIIGHLRWDSDNAMDQSRTDEPLVQPWAKLVRKTFEFRLHPDGRVPLAGITGYQDIRDAVLAPIADQPIASQAYGPAFSDGAARALLERSYGVLPAGPVRVGESWSRVVLQPVPLLGLLRFDRRLRLDSLGADGATSKLSFDTILSRQSMKRLEAITRFSWPKLPWRLLEGRKGPTVSELLRGSERGEIVFDIARGLVISSRTEATLVVETRIAPRHAPAEGPGARSASSEIQQVLTVELLP